MTTRATVVVVGFNSRDHLQRGLPTLRESLSDEDEVLVVDNASSDGSAELLAERFPSVRCKTASSNLGFGAGCNLGAAASESEFLVFLNPDTEVEAGWLDPLLDALGPADVAMSTSAIVLMDEPDRINAVGNEVHYCGWGLCHGLGRPRAEASALLGDDGAVTAVSGAAFAMRRELFEALGGFDEDYFLYVEDTDLSLRARLAGYRIVGAVGSIVRHDYALRVGPEKIFWQERNRYRTLLKNYRATTLLLLAPALLLAEVVGWAFVLLRDRSHAANKLRAYASILTDTESWARGRRQTQALRKIPDHALLGTLDATVDYQQVERSVATSAANALLNPLFVVWRSVVVSVLRLFGV